MKIERLMLTVVLKADAPIAIRSGKPAQPQEAAPIAVDCDRNPYIPATTLKGALRARYTGDNADHLFGRISEREEGTSGAVGFDHAFSVRRDAQSATATHRRTAIDRKRGSAEHNKLFVSEAADAGLTFMTCFSIGVEGRDTDRFERPAALLADALAPLWRGIAVGSGQRQGYGMLKLDSASLVVRRLSDQWQLEDVQDDDLLKALQDSVADAAPRSAIWRKTLKLTADQVFASIDPTEGRGAAVEDRVQLRMAKADDGSPLLATTSVIGALRSRSAWLAELAWLRGTAEIVPTGRNRETDSADNRFIALGTGDGAEQLSSVERLFGVPGWAGLLRVQLTPTPGRTGQTGQRVNIAIDRFSGGALRGALFHTEVTRQPGWALTLSIDAAPARLAAWKAFRETDVAFLDLLVRDLEANGLALGHGAAKGFGWMTVKVAEEADHAG